ncbi:hypothetical protein EZV62_006552 [Acer yangbiense]|uniref:Uncharacterized protein n=1 Tax=Acer yangbiense TaxID=1000413 RepID=A0A5C7I805_9ROSI|nr:hypothetical protein EZV62_006552 [Acer yangbiense]
MSYRPILHLQIRMVAGWPRLAHFTSLGDVSEHVTPKARYQRRQFGVTCADTSYHVVNLALTGQVIVISNDVIIHTTICVVVESMAGERDAEEAGLKWVGPPHSTHAVKFPKEGPCIIRRRSYAWYGEELAKGKLTLDLGDNIKGKGTIQGVPITGNSSLLGQQP